MKQGMGTFSQGMGTFSNPAFQSLLYAGTCLGSSVASPEQAPA